MAHTADVVVIGGIHGWLDGSRIDSFRQWSAADCSAPAHER